MWVAVGEGGKSQLCTDKLGTRDPVQPRWEDPANKQHAVRTAPSSAWMCEPYLPL